MLISVDIYYLSGMRKTVPYRSRKRSERAALMEFSTVCKVDPSVAKIAIAGSKDLVHIHGPASSWEDIARECDEQRTAGIATQIANYPNSKEVGQHIVVEGKQLLIDSVIWGYSSSDYVGHSREEKMPVYYCIDEVNGGPKVRVPPRDGGYNPRELKPTVKEPEKECSCKFCEKEEIILQRERIRPTSWGWGHAEDKISLQEVDYQTEHLYIDRAFLRFVDKADGQSLGHGIKVPINFCPMCGRKLRDEKTNVAI